MSNDPLSLRCSQLPRFLACPPSALEPALDVDSSSEAARIGSAVHGALAQMFRGEQPDLDAFARSWQADAERVRPLYFMARQVWREYAPALDVMEVERQMSAALPVPGADVTLAGSADLVAAEKGGTEALILWDWKTGRSRDYWPQLYGYAWLALQEWPQAPAVRVAVCWIRERAVEIEDLTIDDLQGWIARMRRAASELTGTPVYRPTAENCRWCGRRHECPARRAVVSAAVRDWLPPAARELGEMQPADLAALYPLSRQLKRTLKTYEDALRDALADGPLAIDDEQQIELQEIERTDINASAAWPVLLERLSADQVLSAVRVRKGDILSMVRDAAPRGQKGKEVEALMAALAEAGATEESTFERLITSKREKSDDEADRSGE